MTDTKNLANAADGGGLGKGRDGAPRHRARRGLSPRAQMALAVALAFLCTLCASVELEPVAYDVVAALDPQATGAGYIALEVLCSFPGRDESALVLALGLLLVRPFWYVYFGRGAGATARARRTARAWAHASGEKRTGRGARNGAGSPEAPRARVPRVRVSHGRGASTWVVAALFALAMVFGKSFDTTDSAQLVFGGISQGIKAALSFTGWVLLAHMALVYFYELMDRLRLDRAAPVGTARAAGSSRAARFLRALGRAATFVFDKHPFAAPFALLVALWLPCLIGYAPGLFMWDTGTQILQWFGYPNNASDYLNLIDPAATIVTQHHPPLSTALIGLCVQAGMSLFGSENAGAFLYACLQFVLTAAVFAWATATLRRLGVRRMVRMLIFAFVAFVPVYANYAVLLTKDVLFTDALVVFALSLALGMRAPFAARPGEGPRFTRADAARLVAGALGMALFRNGMWVAVLAGLFLAACVCAWRAHRRPDLIMPRSRWRVIAAVGAAVLIVQLGLTGVVYPALKITPGSRREMLSIPFQQTARFFRDHADQVTPEEYEAVARVLDADALAENYEPEKSDAVKNTFNEDATAEDMAAYFRAWAAEFARDPGCYLEATANNYYGYFYAGHSTNWSYTSEFSREVMQWAKLTPYFSFSQPDDPVVHVFDTLCSYYRIAFQKLPILTLTTNASLYCWCLVLVTAYALRVGERRLLAVLAPVWVVLLVSLVGPCNAATYFRYAYPVAALMPFALGLLTAPARRANPEAA